MRKWTIAIGMLVLSTVAAAADCKQIAHEGGARLWQCDPPAPPPPPVTPIKCWHMNTILVCSGDLDDGAKPANCGWKAGKYVCW